MSTRVIAGEARGRRLQVGRGRDIRPTAGRVKEALFDILVSRFGVEGTEILDLFAGAGGLGIEALSRGAAKVTFVESNAGAVRLLQRNLEQCGLEGRALVLRTSVPAALRRLEQQGATFDGVVLDPPYMASWVQRTLEALDQGPLLRSGAWVVVEHAVSEPVQRTYGRLRLTRERRYGKTALAVLVADGGAAEQSS